LVPRPQQSRSSVVTVVVAESSYLNCQLLETGLRRRHARVSIVGSAVGFHPALVLLEERKPDVAVISAQLEGGPVEGYRVLDKLRSLQSATRSILLLHSRDRDLIIDAFRCGAHGVIFRDEPLETLGRCIHAVHQGQVWANGQHLGYLLDALSHAAPLVFRDGTRLKLLSKRQEDVVRLVADGLTNRDVAAQLGLSEHTVRNYLFTIFDRLGVSTRVELVLYYLQAVQRRAAAGV
jgi:DNA-binding NarL/FixJ family response regulator